MHAIGYVRVSTEEQADHGVSLDAQRGKIAAYCDLRSFTLLGIHADQGLSGKTTKRPGLQAAIRQAESHGGVLVVYSLSRLSRSIVDLHTLVGRLEAAGAQVASCTEPIDTTSAPGRLFLGILAVFAQFERELIVERTTAAMRHKRERGETLGNTPFGWRASHRLPRGAGRGGRGAGAGAGGAPVLVPHPGEQRALCRLLALARAGAGFAQIATTLDREGLEPRGGGTWDRGVVRRIARFFDSEAGRRLLESRPPSLVGEGPTQPPAQDGPAAARACA